VIVQPDADRLDVFARADRGRVARNSNEIPLSPHLQSQNAEAGVRVVKGDALDRAGDLVAMGGARQSGAIERQVQGPSRACICAKSYGTPTLFRLREH